MVGTHVEAAKEALEQEILLILLIVGSLMSTRARYPSGSWPSTLSCSIVLIFDGRIFMSRILLLYFRRRCGATIVLRYLAIDCQMDPRRGLIRFVQDMSR